MVFIEENVEMMREILDYECEELKESEAEERAIELNKKLNNLYKRYSIK
ncbi:MAG: hypothetical protein ACLFVP_01070 [Candidatus Bathyarchaeia archaeon]